MPAAAVAAAMTASSAARLTLQAASTESPTVALTLLTCCSWRGAPPCTRWGVLSCGCCWWRLHAGCRMCLRTAGWRLHAGCYMCLRTAERCVAQGCWSQVPAAAALCSLLSLLLHRHKAESSLWCWWRCTTALVERCGASYFTQLSHAHSCCWWWWAQTRLLTGA